MTVCGLNVRVHDVHRNAILYYSLVTWGNSASVPPVDAASWPVAAYSPRDRPLVPGSLYTTCGAMHLLKYWQKWNEPRT